MKKIVKNFFFIVVALTLVLSACGGEKEAPETVAPSTNEPGVVLIPTDTPAPTPIQPVDIELWAGGRVSEAAPPPDDWVAYDMIASDALVNLKLVLLPSSSGDQDTKINAAAASNSLPDLFMVSRDTWFRLVENGLVANVEELLPLMPERTASHYSDPNRNALVTVDGVMYGLPDPGQFPSTDSTVIRQDWLDALGLKAPTTTDEFMTVAKAFTYDDPDGNGKDDTYGYCAFIDGSGLNAMNLGNRFEWVFGAFGVPGVWNMTSAADFGLNARNPRFKEAVEFIALMNSEGIIDPNWPTLKKDDFRAYWKQGSCGMMRENFAALSTKSNYKAFDENFPEASWVVLPVPAGPYGDRSAGVNVQTARIYAVSQKAMDEGKGPGIARLLEWMSTDGYMLLAFGEEGVNYVLDENGYVTTAGLEATQAWTSAEMQPYTQLANMVYIFSDVEKFARYPSYTTINGRTMKPLDYLAGFSADPWTDATGSAIINPPANAADFTRYYSEGLMQFVLGQQELNDENWAAFLAGLDGLGAAELEAAALETLTSAGFLK